MYAIFETGGKQYTAKVGDVLYIEKLNAEVDQTVTFEKVLAVGDDTMTFGTPYVEGMTVSGKELLLRQNRDVLVGMGLSSEVVDIYCKHLVGTATEEKPAKKAAAPKAEGEKKPAAKKAAAPKAEGEKKPAAKKAAAPKAEGEKKTTAKKAAAPKAEGEKKPATRKTAAKKTEEKGEV